MFIEGPSYLAQRKCVVSLIQTSQQIRDKFDLGTADARHTVFNHIMMISGSAMSLLDMKAAAAGYVPVQTSSGPVPGGPVVEGVLSWSGKSNGEKIGLIWGLERIHKIGFLFGCQSALENGYRNVARALSLSPPFGFFGLSQTVLRAAGLEAQHATARVPAEIRNCLHNNGMFSSRYGDFSHTIDNVTFEFEVGRPFAQATHAHIAHALEASVRVFEALCDSPPVQALPNPISDPFTTEMLANGLNQAF